MVAAVGRHDSAQPYKDSLTIRRHDTIMSFEPASFTAATMIETPQDVRDTLKTMAKAVRRARKADACYPRRSEIVTILTDARVRIDRINAPVGAITSR